MGLFDFVKNAGDKVFSKDDQEAEMNQARADSLTGHVGSLGIEIRELEITFDDGLVTARGITQSQADKEKILLTVGNTYGVGQVDDQLTVVVPEPEAVFYTVKSGDTLGGIAKEHYGNAMKYPTIFEANKPMLTDPNKIYPGQVLRIPALD